MPSASYRDARQRLLSLWPYSQADPTLDSTDVPDGSVVLERDYVRGGPVEGLADVLGMLGKPCADANSGGADVETSARPATHDVDRFTRPEVGLRSERQRSGWPISVQPVPCIRGEGRQLSGGHE